MSLPPNLLDATQADIDRLVADKVRESAHLDFKRELPAVWDEKTKHRFLADATAFANAGGGDILYGVDENSDAAASAVVPQVISGVDAEVRRLQDFLLNLTEPRLPAVQVHAVAVAVDGNVGHVFVVRVPPSWAGPHRVKTNQHFFVRDGLRNRQLEVPEIRALFLRTESQAQQIRDFRTDRLGRVLTGNTPSQLMAGPMLVLHVVPAQAAMGLVQLDPRPYETRQRDMPFVGTSTASTIRLNLDGAVGALHPEPARNSAYVQMFRTGYAELVWVLRRFDSRPKPVLPAIAYEDYLIKFVDRIRSELKRLGYSAATAVMLSILKAREVEFIPSDGSGFPISGPGFDRDTLVLPDVFIENETPTVDGLRAVFDLVWQSAGFQRSLNFDETGKWAPPRV
ncbi:AlbA family DNA-binding domain-containing protein [Ralstonia insidiosa]|uniref:AlbA family DNA-binding domain-containing protein n=1 Tax=Ralstonia insidiosa TaxID=190721 RepID=UPI000CEE279E|nr:ATP-binding protein [Ralstonia insidiosa]